MLDTVVELVGTGVSDGSVSVVGGTEVVVDGVVSVIDGGMAGTEVDTSGVLDSTVVLDSTGVDEGTLAGVEIVASVDTVSRVVAEVVRDRMVVAGVVAGGAGWGPAADSVQVATVTVTVVISINSVSQNFEG